jgi:hypothetical protein
MALHNEKPSTERLDKLARHVLVAAIEFERAKHEARNYGSTEGLADSLCAAIKEYREAMVAELVGTEQTLGG